MTNTEISEHGKITGTKFMEQYYKYVRRKEVAFKKMLGYSRPELSCNVIYGEFVRLHCKVSLKVAGRPKNK